MSYFIGIEGVASAAHGIYKSHLDDLESRGAKRSMEMTYKDFAFLKEVLEELENGGKIIEDKHKLRLVLIALIKDALDKNRD